MISLRIRKVVDTSDWDQSFVDGQGTGLKRSSHGQGDRVASGTTSGAAAAAALRSTWNRKNIGEEEEEEEQMNWKGPEVSCYDDDKRSGPAERSYRHVNPFLDSGPSSSSSSSRDCQSKACLLVQSESDVALNCRTRANDVQHDEHRQFNISVRDLDTSGRRTLPAVGDVTAWLDSLKLFDTSRLRLNTLSSPPNHHPLCSDNDNLLGMHERRTEQNCGISPFDFAEPLGLEERTPTIEDRFFSGTNLMSPASIDGRPSVFNDRSVSVQTAAFEGRIAALEGRHISALDVRVPVFEGPCFEGRTPPFEGRSPAFELRSPTLEGRSSVEDGRFPGFPGVCPASNERLRKPVQSPTVASDTGQSDQVTARAGRPEGVTSGEAALAGETVGLPMAYSRAVSFLPAWDLELLETVYCRLDVCGFYFGRMTTDEARLRLIGYPVGTFLLRDSSDARFLFSLSIQTRRGTTSIRVVYEGGLFRLDSDPDQSYLMPTFHCVLGLVRHYVRLSAGRRSVQTESPPTTAAAAGTNSYVLRESTGRRDTPVLLRRPLETVPASLAHSCRKNIHRRLGNQPQNVSRLHLKPSLKDYLSLYPYDI